MGSHAYIFFMKTFTLRPSLERGHSQFDWLDSRFSFSFADYHDPAHMGFRSLRVINEDHIAPGGGFPAHPHRDMEIITYVLEGELAHTDSLGNGATIKPGEIQRMTAGRGITHSEFNASKTKGVHLLQIWLMPKARGTDASYAQQPIHLSAVTDQFGLLASPDGRDGSVTIGQDANLWLAKLGKGKTAEFDLKDGRGAWAQIARGRVALEDTDMNAGDGANWDDSGKVHFTAKEDSEILLFDLA
jgi:redox-sensitive bicupin YhaK (pirin superfamily)